MSDDAENKPAYPINEKHDDGEHYLSRLGISTRLYVATRILPAVLAAPWFGKSAESVVEATVDLADALIDECNARTARNVRNAQPKGRSK